jgi:hypothetical protein
MRWSVRDLAEVSGVSSATIKRMEETDDTPPSLAENVRKIQAAFEAVGIIFIAENGEGPGVRLKKQKPDEGTRPQQLTSENDT